MTGRGALALGALALILVVTAAWWALALLPLAAATPEWLMRAREVCFGAPPDALPDAGGWILLVGEPIGLLAVLVVVWGDALREGLRLASARPAGRIVLAGVGLGLVAGLGAAARLVAQAQAQPFATGGPVGRPIAADGLDRAAPALRLVDQHGDSVDLQRFRGRPVIVTFGFGHCSTICPLTVQAARSAVRRLADRRAALLVVTLDPWRDTPSRLAFVAAQWELDRDMHLLGGDVPAVESALSAWRVPRARNMASGDVAHPALVYIVDGGGRLAYALGPDADAIVGAVESLPEPAGDPNVLDGPAVPVGNGTARLFVELGTRGEPQVLGIALTGGALTGLAERMNTTSRCHDKNRDGTISHGECLGDYETELALPAGVREAGVPVGWATVNWNPEGHVAPAPPVWSAAHFDFHFFLATPALIRGIRTGPCGEFIHCEDSVRASKSLPPQHAPEGYLDVGAAVAAMGNHLIDSRDPELADSTLGFSSTFIYGAYDGKLIFLEPMVSHAFLAKRPQDCRPLRTPRAYATAGYYPTTYCVRYDVPSDTYRVTLEGLVRRQAG